MIAALINIAIIMFLSDKFVYVDLNKTGTCSVMNWLNALNVPKKYAKHHLKPSEYIINSDRIKVATIRDPWSFYLSLWSYGCKKKSKSGPYNSLTEFRLQRSTGWKNARWWALRSVFEYLAFSLNEDYSRKHLKNMYL